jgi:DNA-directed RNA polymerase specialized sigma24 family protein
VMSRLHRGRKKIREQLLASGFGTPRAESTGA